MIYIRLLFYRYGACQFFESLLDHRKEPQKGPLTLLMS